MADHHRDRVNAGPHRDLAAFGHAATDPVDRLDDLGAGAHPAFGVVTVRPRPAEIRDDPIALVLCNIAVVAPNDPRNGLMIGLYDMVIFLGIEAGGALS